MDPFYYLLQPLFLFLRPPKLRLRVPKVSLPSAMTVFALVLISYFFVISGLVFDVIQEPPGMGVIQDPRTGAQRPVVFMEGRVNSQYIIEGLSAGFMIVLGGVSLLALDAAADKSKGRNTRLGFLGAGAFGFWFSYQMAILFLRFKVPGYLVNSQ
ncbi:hypothetical protein KFL_000610130 [Klebsormidium nitens]|uniref:Oligosaccharyltransferase complex subunit n=1 Tax=Klebsormidium nitens TaxID=105231 RepID=A0A0U9HU35_KLENI|nr:hypothetical protein KFL_000610130 [Klebsormidium nitens]|eukprot:GAQ80735.1 hypothetical protein KFL_000610130 [Klebsormidium nitens]